MHYSKGFQSSKIKTGSNKFDLSKTAKKIGYHIQAASPIKNKKAHSNEQAFYHTLKRENLYL